jgi:predicted transcriptional regulator
MAKRNQSGGGRAKTVNYVRLDPDIVAALDEIRESMSTKPTRVQIINAACAEYVKRHGKGQQAKAGR